MTAGEALLAGATVDEHGWSWAAPGRAHPPPICGLSHGASGIGWALLELFVATGDERFREGADGAFAVCEHSWLVTGRRGRAPTTGSRANAAAARTASHRRRSAPGATARRWRLVRMRARAALGPHADRGDADRPRAAARSHLAAALPYAFEDLSLCHGLSGTGRRAVRTPTASLLQNSATRRSSGTPTLATGRAPRREVMSQASSRTRRHRLVALLRLHDPSVASPVRIPLRLDTLENHS